MYTPLWHRVELGMGFSPYPSVATAGVWTFCLQVDRNLKGYHSTVIIWYWWWLKMVLDHGLNGKKMQWARTSFGPFRTLLEPENFRLQCLWYVDGDGMSNFRWKSCGHAMSFTALFFLSKQHQVTTEERGLRAIPREYFPQNFRRPLVRWLFIVGRCPIMI